MIKIIRAACRWILIILQAATIIARPSRRKHLRDWCFARSIYRGCTMSHEELAHLEALIEIEILVPLERTIPVVLENGLIRWVNQPKLA